MSGRLVAFALDIGIVRYSILVPVDEQVLYNVDFVFLAWVSEILNEAVNICLQAWSFCGNLHRFLRSNLFHSQIYQRRVLFTQ
jgi:hypothetical protein